jgi:hypothetical protein
MKKSCALALKEPRKNCEEEKKREKRPLFTIMISQIRVTLTRIDRVSKAEIYYQNQERDHPWERFKKFTQKSSKRRRCGWPRRVGS